MESHKFLGCFLPSFSHQAVAGETVEAATCTFDCDTVWVTGGTETDVCELQKVV